MPIEVEGPDGAVIEFPDGTPPATMQAAMRKHYASSRPKAPAQRPSVSTAIKQGAGDFARDVTNGFFALPDMLSQAGNAITNAVTNAGVAVADPLLRAAGADGAANSLGRFARTATAAPAPTMRGLNQRINPEAPGRQSSSLPGELIGGALMPFGPKAAKTPIRAPNALATVAKPTAAREVVDAGKKAGVRVMTSDVKPPKTFIGKGVQQLGERVPFLGTGGNRSAQQAERSEAVRNLAREYGAAQGDELTAPAIDGVMADFAATRGAEVSRFAKAKTAIIEGTQGQVPVGNTVAAIDKQIDKFSKVETDGAKSLVAKLQGWKQSLTIPGRTEATGILDASGNPIVRTIAPQGKDLATIDLIRAEMGQVFKDPSLAAIKDAGQKSLESIYGPMKTDMGAFIKQAGGPEKLAQWNKSNLVLAGMADELKVSTLRSVLRTGKGTPEEVGRILFSNKPSLVRRLYANMSGEGRAKAQAAVLQRAIEKSGGMENTSPEKFITQMTSLGRTAGIHFPEADLARVQGLTRVLKATARAGQANVMTNSGQQLAPVAVGAVGVSHPWLVGGGALLARAYESAAVRDALLKLSRTAPGSKQEAIQLGRASGVIAPLIQKYGAAVNDNTMVSAAARQSDEQQNQQQAAPQP